MGYFLILLCLVLYAGTVDSLDYRERKNLTDLTETERVNLRKALGQAKQKGTYSGPKISDIAGFDTAFTAATSFHGYPYLCEGDGCCIHSYSTFLPWHRLQMIQLEDSLRADTRYADVTLPYWDFTRIIHKLPKLVTKPNFQKKPNPFFNSDIPGKDSVTRRSDECLINYTNGKCKPSATQHCWPGVSVLMDQTLTALEEKEYKKFEEQIEYPHNMVHNYL